VEEDCAFVEASVERAGPTPLASSGRWCGVGTAGAPKQLRGEGAKVLVGVLSDYRECESVLRRDLIRESLVFLLGRPSSHMLYRKGTCGHIEIACG
jgi:hypothetical protein